MRSVHTYGSDALSPWISPTIRTRADAAEVLAGDAPCVLLIDDQLAFRHAVASSLDSHGIRVLTATGVYDAWHAARRRRIDLIVIRGRLRSQSGWQCAAKLCGCPPWHGVVMHFDHASDEDRAWAAAAELTGLVDTAGRPGDLAESVLRLLLDAASPEPASPDSRPLSMAWRA